MIYLRTQYPGGATATPIRVKKMPGGEVHPEIEAEMLIGSHYTIVSDTRSSEDLFAILMVANAVRRSCEYPAGISLIIGYTPYARQDRVANPGEALSIEGFADFINMMNFDQVTIHDPHSDVTPALIKNCRVVDQAEIIAKAIHGNPKKNPNRIDLSEYVLVAPDAGAIKKTNKLAKEFNAAGVIYADKVRDTQTGKITHTALSRASIRGVDGLEHIAGKKLLVVDDICDGGRTFIELAAVLKEQNPESIELFVTHGIFSKGTECLIEAGYSRIFTTNCFRLENFNTEEHLWDEPVEHEVVKYKLITLI